MIRHLQIYAYASPESLCEVAEKANMGLSAVDMFRHAEEWEITVAVDTEDGTVKAAELSSNYGLLKQFPEDRPKWEKLWGKKDDHHFFKDTVSGQIAIADNSMTRKNDPTSTDDGILWVNFNKPIRIYTSNGRTGIDLWVTDKKGESYRCGLSASAAKFIKETFQMKVEFV